MKLIRIFFSKTGRAKYISHLDIMRCMERALKRSALPVWFTEGYNPHVYMTFSMPLSLGFESECESMDIKLLEDISFEEVKERLGKVLPREIVISHIAEPVMKPEKIAYADYEISLAFDDVSAEALEKALMEFFAQEEILVMKKSKKGPKEVDLKPLFSVLEQSAELGKINLVLRCQSGISLNINPTLIVDALKTKANLNCDCCNIKKKQLYTTELEIFC